MNWLKQLFSRHHQYNDLSEEIQEHLEEKIEELVAGGMSRNEATYAARREFGNVRLTEEDSRTVWRWPSFEDFLMDLRYGLRMLRKDTGFTAVAVLTLALGIAVNATMFSLVSGFLLARPPGREPERVAAITSVNPAGRFLPDASAVSAPNYLAWRQANHVFEDMAAADAYRTVNLSSQFQSTADGPPEPLRDAAVSPNYFSVLGVSPQLGRTFSDGEDQPGRDHVAILSHEIWERRFGSDASLIGRTIRLNRENYTVIGVMPASFSLLGFPHQLWTPLVLTAADQTAAARKDRSLYLFARLKPGVTLDEARAEVVTLARGAGETFPETEKGWGAGVRTLPDFLVYAFGIRNALAILMTTVGFVLMIACANVAGLLLARSAGRRKELAVRIALGVSIVCAVLCGLAPALNASRADVNTNLKDESRTASQGRSHNRLRRAMVTGEVALALFLLVGTGLLIRGIFLIAHQNLGFRPDHLLTAGVTLDNARYKEASQQARFVQDVVPRLQQIPGAAVVAVASDLPATGPNTVTLQVKGQPELPANQRLRALDVLVSTDYFRAAAIPLLHGRTFAETDNATAPPVIVVNEEFVQRHLLGHEPLGKQIRLDVSGSTPQWSEIVGVVANVKTHSEGSRDDPEVYEPFLQRPVSSFSLMVRPTSDPNSLASALRSAIAQMDAELPLARVMSMPEVIEHQRGGDSFFVTLLGGFALLALILAAIGIYGLIAYSVGQRTHEIGIRLALGARNPDVLRMILREGLKMSAIGSAIGLALALPLPKLFDAMFYGLYLSELRLYFIVPTAILLTAMLATYIPARRAMRVDPMVALRHE